MVLVKSSRDKVGFLYDDINFSKNLWQGLLKYGRERKTGRGKCPEIGLSCKSLVKFWFLNFFIIIKFWNVCRVFSELNNKIFWYPSWAYLEKWKNLKTPVLYIKFSFSRGSDQKYPILIGPCLIPINTTSSTKNTCFSGRCKQVSRRAQQE